MEQLVGIFVFLPVAISLVVLSFNIRREFLYGTKHDVFRRDLFFGKPVHDVSEERNETKRKSGVVHRGTILATWNKKSNSLRLVLAQKEKADSSLSHQNMDRGITTDSLYERATVQEGFKEDWAEG